MKTVRFRAPRYIGDPINAVHIFNSKEADELFFLDIGATRARRLPPLNLLERIGAECFMPFSVGGGIRTTDDIRLILNTGAEKVVLSTHALERPLFIKEAADTFGSSTIVACLDVRKRRFRGYDVRVRNGSKSIGLDPREAAAVCQRMGAGELVVNAIDRDGTMEGYDIELVRMISDEVDVPVVACGGAGQLADFTQVWDEGRASAAAAGSFFVYHGPRRAVLINFPSRTEQESLYLD